MKTKAFLRPMRRCALATMLFLGNAGGAVPPPSPPTLSVTADYDAAAGTVDKDRLFNASQGGYAAMQNLNWFPDAFNQLAALGFKTIRLDHLVNDQFYRVVSRDAAGALRCDFSRLDRIILPLTARGLTPLMCLSYCPDALIPRGGTDGSVPQNLAGWRQLAGDYVRHYKALGHTGWYWEVWNEPDNHWFFRGTDRQYVELYAATAAAIKTVDPAARVGGAADASVRSRTARLGPLLDYVKAHPAVPLDFISYHKYGGSTRDEQPPYDLDWDLGPVQGLLAARGLPPREILATEWNLTPTMDAGAGAETDTARAAAGAAARLFNALRQPALTKIFYFAPLEGYRPARRLNGDLGLLTVNYHRKAVANVFQLYAGLGRIRVRTTIGGGDAPGHATYALAAKNADRRQLTVLLWNYGAQSVPVDLALQHLPYAAGGPDVRLMRYLIDAEHANYYADYQAGRRGRRPGPTEELVPLEVRAMPAAAEFRQAGTLPPFSVAALVLEPVTAGAAPPAVRPRVNLAAGRPVTASSSLEKDGWGAQRLVDEITHSLPGALGWSSAARAEAEHPEWVAVDLGRAAPIHTVVCYPRDDQAAEGGGFPADFHVQGSDDGVRWFELAARSANDGGAPVPGAQTFACAPRRCRHVRLLATRLGRVSATPPEYRCQLAELEVYGGADDRSP